MIPRQFYARDYVSIRGNCQFVTILRSPSVLCKIPQLESRLRWGFADSAVPVSRVYVVEVANVERKDVSLDD